MSYHRAQHRGSVSENAHSYSESRILIISHNVATIQGRLTTSYEIATSLYEINLVLRKNVYPNILD